MLDLKKIRRKQPMQYHQIMLVYKVEF